MVNQDRAKCAHYLLNLYSAFVLEDAQGVPAVTLYNYILVFATKLVSTTEELCTT